MAALLKRVNTAFSPPAVPKQEDALRVGILGAAKIAPMALITPAKSHPEVVIQAVAARDRAKAEAYAKANGIPQVCDSYQGILDDPAIDVVFIPLANSLHMEWAIRSIRAGKHVLLEKPATATAAEAELLFNLPELSQPNAPVLLEAAHNRFHPALHKFLTFIDAAQVERVYTDSMVPWLMTGKDNIEFNYDLAGGCMMHLGSYNFSVLRMIFGDSPAECLECDTTVFGDGVHDQCDTDFKAKFRFPNGGIGEAKSSLRGPMLWKPSEARVSMRSVVVADDSLSSEQEKWRQRQVTMHGFMQAIFWHRIDVKDTFEIRTKKDGRTVKKWTESNSYKSYTLQGSSNPDWWNSYRWQLECFVNRVKGRPAQYWVDGEDSINLMKMIDMAYEKSGLGLRPTSTYR